MYRGIYMCIGACMYVYVFRGICICSICMYRGIHRGIYRGIYSGIYMNV
jgi:hypothetical protein